MQSFGLPWAYNFASPDIQATRLLAMQLLPFKAFLHPLPILLAFLFRQRANLWVLLRVPLEHAGTDQVGGITHGMHQRLGVVDDEPP